MKLIVILILAAIPIILLKLRQLHLHVDLKSFFKKGFIPFTSPHGLVTYTGEQGSR